MAAEGIPTNPEFDHGPAWNYVFTSLGQFFSDPLLHFRGKGTQLGLGDFGFLTFRIIGEDSPIGTTGLTIEKFKIDRSMKTILRFEPEAESESAEYSTDDARPTYGLTIEYVDVDGSMVIRYIHGRRDPQDIPLGKATVKNDGNNHTVAYINANMAEGREARLPTQDEMNILLLEAEDVLLRLAL